MMCEDSILSTTFTTANLNAACSLPVSSHHPIHDQRQLKVIPFLTGLDGDECDEGDEEDEEDDEDDDELTETTATSEAVTCAADREALFGELAPSANKQHRSGVIRTHQLSNNNNLSPSQLTSDEVPNQLQQVGADESHITSSSNRQQQQHLVSIHAPRHQHGPLNHMVQSNQTVGQQQQHYQQHPPHMSSHQIQQHQHHPTAPAVSCEGMFGEQQQLLSGRHGDAENNHPPENSSTSGSGSTASMSQASQNSHHYLTNTGPGSLPPFCTL